MIARLEQYRIFKEVADAGNLTAAAQRLYISQSAVSQSIKALEASLEAQLFTRLPRGVSLTAEGQTLYEYASKALGLLQAGEHHLQQMRELVTGELSIGINSTLMKYFLMPILESYHKAYPQIRIHIHGGTSGRVLEALKDGQIDLAFCTTPAESSALHMVTCFPTHTAFVAAPDYPCDFTRAYTTEEIAAFPLILLEKKASSRTYLEKYFLQSGVRLTPEIELGARSLLVDLAKIGFGVAGVTREFVQGELAAGEIRELSTAFSIPPRTVDLCMLRNVSPSAATERFARDVLEKLQGKSVSV